MILLDNEYVLLEHEPEHDLISGTWKKYTPSHVYREMLIFGYEAIVRTQASRNLSDLRNLPTISQEDTYWTVELIKKYYTQIAIGKIYKTAVLLPEASFTKLALDSMNEEFKIHHKDMNARTISMYFDTIEAARAWLLE